MIRPVLSPLLLVAFLPFASGGCGSAHRVVILQHPADEADCSMHASHFRRAFRVADRVVRAQIREGRIHSHWR